MRNTQFGDSWKLELNHQHLLPYQPLNYQFGSLGAPIIGLCLPEFGGSSANSTLRTRRDMEKSFRHQ